MRRVPKSARGEATWKRIFDSAQRLFLEKGYHKTSVLAVSKEASISPATFYQYFGSKNEIFEMILESFQNEFFNLVKSVFGSNLPFNEKIAVLTERVFDTFWRFRAEYKVFREAEFIDKKLCLSFHNTIKESLVETGIFSDDPLEIDAVFWFYFGPLFYIAGYWILWQNREVPDNTRSNLQAFYLKGISASNTQPSRNVFTLNREVFQPVEGLKMKPQRRLNRGEQSKKKLLDSAEKLFGNRGYFETTVHEICSDSGLSVGTFYLYFSSKFEILRVLVERTSKELRHIIKQYMNRFEDRRDQEIAGYKGFLAFFSQHSNMYGVVRESEFIDSCVTLEYYNSLQEPYKHSLEKAMKKGQIRKTDSDVLTSILMGIGHLLGQSLLILEKTETGEFSHYLKPLSVRVLEGFKVGKTERKEHHITGGQK